MVLKFVLFMLLALSPCFPEIEAEVVEVFLYDMIMFFTEESNEFEVNATIYFRSWRKSNEIGLRLNSTKFMGCKLKSEKNNTKYFCHTNVRQEHTNVLIFSPKLILEIGENYTLHLRYMAPSNGYRDRDGKIRVLGISKLGPFHACEVFPCFDDTKQKAKFHLKIINPEKYHPFTNAQVKTQVEKIKPVNHQIGYRETDFALTPEMPTRMVGFVIADVLCDPVHHNNDSFVMCQRREVSRFTYFALDFVPKIVQDIETLTQVLYNTTGTKKVHLIVVPDQATCKHIVGSWGLVIYKESDLLCSPDESSNHQKQTVIRNLIHGLSHLWFGNRVTSDWWSNIFVTEGLAAYLEYHLKHRDFILFELKYQFVVDQMHAALVLDSLPNSVALCSNEIHKSLTPEEIMDIFPYSKGASFFRMVEHVMGSHNFKLGLQQFFKNHHFANSSRFDLWEALQSHASTPVDFIDFLENWVTTPGYPVLNITASGTSITITQRKFLSSGENDQSSYMSTRSTTHIWLIPVSYTISSDMYKFRNTTPQLWLKTERNYYENILKSSSQWIIINNQQTGFFRVDYDKHLWYKIKLALYKTGFDGIHELNRAQLIDDLYHFTKSGYHDFFQLFDFYQFLEFETSYFTWKAACGAFSDMLRLVSSQETRDKLLSQIRVLMAVVYDSVSFFTPKDYNQMYSLKKEMVISNGCKFGFPHCIKRSVAALEDYEMTKKKPDKNLRSTIYCYGLRHSSNVTKYWEFLWTELESTKLEEEAFTILKALACPLDKNILANYLFKSLNPSSGLKLEKPFLTIFFHVCDGSFKGLDFALDFLLDHYPAIIKPSNQSVVKSLIIKLYTKLTTKDQLDKIVEFTKSVGLIKDNELVEKNHLAGKNVKQAEILEDSLDFYFSPKETNSTNSSRTFQRRLYDL